MAHVNAWSQIIEIAQKLSDQEASSSGNATPKSSALFPLPPGVSTMDIAQPLGTCLFPHTSARPLMEAFQGSSFDNAAWSQLATTFNLRHANAPSVVAAGEPALHTNPHNISSILRLLPHDVVVELLSASNVSRLGVNPCALAQMGRNTSVIPDLQHVTSPFASLGVDASSILASTASSSNGSDHSAMRRILLEAIERQEQEQNEQHHFESSSSETILHSARCSSTSAPEPSSVTSRNKEEESSCNRGVDRNNEIPSHKPNFRATGTEVASPISRSFDASGPVESGKVDAIMLPCRARGMPKDHNFQNAHFIIPPGLRHGQDMMCSHSKCRNSGIKFRYCAICRLPVAKRNFYQRHSHELDRPDSHNSANASVCSPDNVLVGEDQSVDQANAPQGQTNTKPKVGMRSGTEEGPVWCLADDDQNSATSQRKRKWNDLLERRPASSDTPRMSAWLLEVISVSEADTRLEHATGQGVMSSNMELVSFLRRQNGEQVQNTAPEFASTMPCHPFPSEQEKEFAFPNRGTRQLSSKRQRHEAETTGGTQQKAMVGNLKED